MSIPLYISERTRRGYIPSLARQSSARVYRHLCVTVLPDGQRGLVSTSKPQPQGPRLIPPLVSSTKRDGWPLPTMSLLKQISYGADSEVRALSRQGSVFRHYRESTLCGFRLASCSSFPGYTSSMSAANDPSGRNGYIALKALPASSSALR
jgi:hypothetical protein